MLARTCNHSRSRSLASPSSRSARSLGLTAPPEPATSPSWPSPSRRRGGSFASGALPPRGRAARAAPSRQRSSAPSPSSRSSSSRRPHRPATERRGRLERGQVQQAGASWAARAAALHAAVAPRPRATPHRAHDGACRAEHSALMRRAGTPGAYQGTPGAYQGRMNLIWPA